MIHPRKFLWSMILLIGAISLVSCGGGGGSSTPTPTPTPTGTVTKFAILDGTQEVPQVTTSAAGMGTLTVNADTGAISGFLKITTLPTGTVTAAHIHSGARGANGAVVVGLTDSGNGVWSVPATLTQAEKDGVLAGFIAGNLYYNVHTGATFAPEIRGQIDQSTATLYARLDGTQEVPQVTTSATGTGSLTVNADTGAVTGSLTITVPPVGTVTAAHIHSGARGANGAVVVGLTDSGNGVWSVPATLTQAEKDGILAGFIAGNLYYNVHTGATFAPEIRGQIDLIAP